MWSSCPLSQTLPRHLGFRLCASEAGHNKCIKQTQLLGNAKGSPICHAINLSVLPCCQRQNVNAHVRPIQFTVTDGCPARTSFGTFRVLRGHPAILRKSHVRTRTTCRILRRSHHRRYNTRSARDIEYISGDANKISLSLNIKKCEIISNNTGSSWPGILSQFLPVSQNKACLLGAPLTTSVFTSMHQIPWRQTGSRHTADQGPPLTWCTHPTSLFHQLIMNAAHYTVPHAWTTQHPTNSTNYCEQVFHKF